MTSRALWTGIVIALTCVYVALAWLHIEADLEIEQLRKHMFDRALVVYPVPGANTRVDPLARSPSQAPAPLPILVDRTAIDELRALPEVEDLFIATAQYWSMVREGHPREDVFLFGVDERMIEKMNLGNPDLLKSGVVLDRTDANLPDQTSVLSQARLEVAESILTDSTLTAEARKILRELPPIEIAVVEGGYASVPGGTAGYRVAYMDRLASFLPGPFQPSPRLIIILRNGVEQSGVIARIRALVRAKDVNGAGLVAQVDHVRGYFPRPLSTRIREGLTAVSGILLGSIVALALTLRALIDARLQALEIALRRVSGQSTWTACIQTYLKPVRSGLVITIMVLLLSNTMCFIFMPASWRELAFLTAWVTFGGGMFAAIILVTGLLLARRQPLKAIKRYVY